MGDEDSKDAVVETDPTGRFQRYKERLGAGAFKIVHKGFDNEEGLEIAWNQIKVDRLSVAEKSKLFSEVSILRNLKHKNIINFYHYWNDAPSDQIIIITECMTSGTLKQYIARAQNPKPKVIKHWCREILQGLLYLHTRKPPIIHRDLKCDNIFINGNHGEVKIGDLGLATMMNRTHAQSVIGTPEFMAPELYEEKYNEKADIYSFGMCVLEMVTGEYPYGECQNPAQVFKKVSQGIRPSAFDRIEPGETRDFIELCLEKEGERPSAAELLSHPFIRNVEGKAPGVIPVKAPTAIPEPKRVETVEHIKIDNSHGHDDASEKGSADSEEEDSDKEDAPAKGTAAPASTVASNPTSVAAGQGAHPTPSPAPTPVTVAIPAPVQVVAPVSTAPAVLPSPTAAQNPPAALVASPVAAVPISVVPVVAPGTVVVTPGLVGSAPAAALPPPAVVEVPSGGPGLVADDGANGATGVITTVLPTVIATDEALAAIASGQVTIQLGGAVGVPGPEYALVQPVMTGVIMDGSVVLAPFQPDPALGAVPVPGAVMAFTTNPADGQPVVAYNVGDDPNLYGHPGAVYAPGPVVTGYTQPDVGFTAGYSPTDGQSPGLFTQPVGEYHSEYNTPPESHSEAPAGQPPVADSEEATLYSDVQFKGAMMDEMGRITVNLMVCCNINGSRHKLSFQFVFGFDTPSQLAKELVDNFNLTEEDANLIEAQIQAVVRHVDAEMARAVPINLVTVPRELVLSAARMTPRNHSSQGDFNSPAFSHPTPAFGDMSQQPMSYLPESSVSSQGENGLSFEQMTAYQVPYAHSHSLPALGVSTGAESSVGQLATGDMVDPTQPGAALPEPTSKQKAEISLDSMLNSTMANLFGDPSRSGFDDSKIGVQPSMNELMRKQQLSGLGSSNSSLR